MQDSCVAACSTCGHDGASASLALVSARIAMPIGQTIRSLPPGKGTAGLD